MDDESLELPPEAEARLAALQRAQRSRREAEQAEKRARRAMWRTHHWPDHYDRCAVVAGRHLCRRCLTLYPVALGVMAASLAVSTPWPGTLDVVVVWLLCIPATIEFLAEKLLGATYRPLRQVLVTALVGLALGRGLAHEIDDRWSPVFWGPVVVFGSIWFMAAVAELSRNMMQTALERSLEYGPHSQDS